MWGSQGAVAPDVATGLAEEEGLKTPSLPFRPGSPLAKEKMDMPSTVIPKIAPGTPTRISPPQAQQGLVGPMEPEKPVLAPGQYAVRGSEGWTVGNAADVPSQRVGNIQDREHLRQMAEIAPRITAGGIAASQAADERRRVAAERQRIMAGSGPNAMREAKAYGITPKGLYESEMERRAVAQRQQADIKKAGIVGETQQMIESGKQKTELEKSRIAAQGQRERGIAAAAGQVRAAEVAANKSAQGETSKTVESILSVIADLESKPDKTPEDVASLNQYRSRRDELLMGKPAATDTGAPGIAPVAAAPAPALAPGERLGTQKSTGRKVVLDAKGNVIRYA